eukprot:jgi/Botrbrau1/20747/Bobra.0058s0075.1
MLSRESDASGCITWCGAERDALLCVGCLNLEEAAESAADRARVDCLKYLFDMDPGLQGVPLLRRTAEAHNVNVPPSGQRRLHGLPAGPVAASGAPTGARCWRLYRADGRRHCSTALSGCTSNAWSWPCARHSRAPTWNACRCCVPLDTSNTGCSVGGATLRLIGKMKV